MNGEPRFQCHFKPTTPANVGPNTYSPTKPVCDYRKVSYAPFLSNTTRKCTTKPDINVEFYNAVKPSPKIKYGNSMQFTEPRKTIVGRKAERSEEKYYLYKEKPSKRYNNRGKLYMCRVPFTVEASAPTIPTEIDQNGYDLDENRKIIKNPATEYDRTIGPAFYNVPRGEIFYNSIVYKGCAWSKLRSQRNKIVGPYFPGPADYDPKLKICIERKENDQFKALMRKCCNVPRMTCEIICRAQKENQPGPGHYEIVDLDKIGKVKNLSLNPNKPFVTGAERFNYKSGDSPGSQHYVVCDCFKQSKDFSISNVPFCYGAERFQANKMHDGPSPCQYNIKKPNYCSYSGNMPKPGFGSSARRKTTRVENIENPGPAEYCLSSGIHCCPQEKVHQSSVFKSMECRFGRAKPKANLGPAFYDAEKSYKVLTSKKSHATGKILGFNSTEKKFTRMYDFSGLKVGVDAPGVGIYNLDTECMCKSTGQYFNKSPRFNYKNNGIPAPDQYNLSYMHTEACNKAISTFNTRLMKDLKRKCPLMKGPQISMRYAVKMSRRKILKWFIRNGDCEGWY